MMTIDVYNIAPIKAPRLARFLATVALLLTPWTQAEALGLGEVSVSSAINEPLSAEIELLNLQGLEESELIVSLGTSADYNLAGVRYNFSHAEIDFESDFSNPLRPRIRVTTDRPIAEPYLNFVVQARWPSGRLLREYTILLDLPVFSGESASSRAAAPPAQASSTVPPPSSQNTQPVRVTPSPAAGAPPTPAGSYRVQFGDTLWEIAQRIANETGVTHAQAMLSLRDMNPEAFLDGNLNRIMSGSLLRIPTQSQSMVRDPNSARAQVASELGLGSGTPLQSTSASAAGQASGEGGQFRLAASENGALGPEGQGGGSAGLAQIEAENTVLEEQLDAANLENIELRERLAQLQEQIDVLERLVEVENADLAQAQTLESQDQPPPAVVVTPPPSPQLSLMDRLMGWIQWIGIALVGLLIAVYLVVKRRASSDDGFDMAKDIDDEEESGFADDSDESDESDFDDLDEEPTDDFDADATVVLGSSPDDSEVTAEEEPEDEEFSVPDEAEDDEDAVVIDDDDTDFDDLDAFFSDIEDKGASDGGDDFDEEALIQDEAGSETDDDALEDLDDEDESTELDDLTAEGAAEDSDADLDEADSDLGFDVDMDEPDAESPQPEEDDAGGLEFSTDLDEAKEEPDQEVASESGQDSDEDNSAMDFDLGDVEIDTEDSGDPVTEQAETDDSVDNNAMDFDVSLDDSEGQPEIDPEAETSDDDTAAAEASTEPEETDDVEDATSESDDTDDLDDSIFADLGDDDLDDLLGPEGDDAAGSGFAEEEPETEIDDDAEISLDTEENQETESADGTEFESDDGDEDLSSLTAMLDNDDPDLDTSSDEAATDSPDEAELQMDESSDSAEPADQEDTDLDAELELDTLAFDSGESGDSPSAEECDTKLELAEAYIDMGDESGAQTLLKEVIDAGSDDQKAKAQELLEKIS